MFKLGGGGGHYICSYTGADPGLGKSGGGHKAEYAQEQCVCSAQQSGGMPPRKSLSFRRSEINFGAFWDTFSWQGTHTSIRFDTTCG